MQKNICEEYAIYMDIQTITHIHKLYGYYAKAKLESNKCSSFWFLYHGCTSSQLHMFHYSPASINSFTEGVDTKQRITKQRNYKTAK